MVELIRAIEKGDEARARKYLKGVSLNMHGKEGITPLFWLMTHKDKAGMRLAIKLGADPNFAAPKGDTPVTLMTGANDDELLLILLEGGMPIQWIAMVILQYSPQLLKNGSNKSIC